MTFNGWLQIALYAVLVVLLTKPLGGYMTRVFAGERTLLRPVLRPIEVGIYKMCGVDEREEQHWVSYADRDAGVQLRRLRHHVRHPAAAERAAVEPAGPGCGFA